MNTNFSPDNKHEENQIFNQNTPTDEYPSFNEFIFDTLRYRCSLKQEYILKYFDTEESMKLMLQAFSRELSLLKFYGDSEINLCVTQYIKNKWPTITSVMWLSRIKHNIITGKLLAKIAINYNFHRYLQYTTEPSFRLGERDCPNTISSEKQSFSETEFQNNIEAFCGAISIILTNHCGVGIAHVACYKLISNMLDSVVIPIEYDVLFDAISRLKLIFDNQGWSNNNKTSIKNCLKCEEFKSDTLIRFFKGESYRTTSIQFKKRGSILPTAQQVGQRDYKWICFGYIPLAKNKIKLYSVTTSNNKTNAKAQAAKELIEILNKKGITIPNPLFKNKTECS